MHVQTLLAMTTLVTVLMAGGGERAVAAGANYQPLVGQEGKDVIWVPTQQVLIERMLNAAKVAPNDYVIDLGSGDGRTVIAAAKRGAKALGIEYNADMVELSREQYSALVELTTALGRLQFERTLPGELSAPFRRVLTAFGV